MTTRVTLCVDTIYVLIWRKFSIIWNFSLVFHEFVLYWQKQKIIKYEKIPSNQKAKFFVCIVIDFRYIIMICYAELKRKSSSWTPQFYHIRFCQMPPNLEGWTQHYSAFHHHFRLSSSSNALRIPIWPQTEIELADYE